MSIRLCLAWLCLLVLIGCDSGKEQAASGENQAAPQSEQENTDPELAQATLAAWQSGADNLRETLTSCAELHGQIVGLLDDSSTETLTAARQAWHQCHDHWHQLEPLLALADSNPGLFGDLERVSFDIDAHPIQPGYLDSLADYPYSGIVNDITLDINAPTLREQHGLTDDSDVVLGLHALEFLLWGEQGERPASDYDQQSEPADKMTAELNQSQLPNNRRRELIRLTSQLLQDDLKSLEQHWTSKSGQLPVTYRKLPPSSRLPLLRDAVRSLLNDRLPSELLQRDDAELAHNRFAGDTRRVVIAALAGTEQLLKAGEPALTNWLLPLENQDHWKSQWQDLNEQLDDLGPESTEELLQQLTRLGELLKPAISEEAEVLPSL